MKLGSVVVLLSVAEVCHGQDNTQSQGFGGVQLGSDLQCASLIDANKAKIIKDILPCKCRVKSEVAVGCHPNCCETDRCWSGNEREWSPYEQIICRPSTTEGNSFSDGVCLYTGGNPHTVVGNLTAVNFYLSTLVEYFCIDLILSSCLPSDDAADFTFRTDSNLPCRQLCPPPPIEPCTSTSCLYNRGRTHPFVRSWVLNAHLPPGAYMLTCVTIQRLNAGVTEVNQTQYLPTAFEVA